MRSLNIKDKKVADKARRLARLKGTSVTAAVSQALDESLVAASRNTASDREAREAEVDEVVRTFRSRLKRGAPSPWKVLDDLYEDTGQQR